MPTSIRQEDQIRSSSTYDQTITPGATMESSATSLQDDLNSIRTQLKTIIGSSKNWYTDVELDSDVKSIKDIVAEIATLSPGSHTHVVANITDFSTGVFNQVSGSILLGGTGIDLTVGVSTVSISLDQSEITGVGTLSSGSIPASLITAGTFGTGTYSFNGVLNVDNLKIDGNTLSSTSGNIEMVSFSNILNISTTGSDRLLTINATSNDFLFGDIDGYGNQCYIFIDNDLSLFTFNNFSNITADGQLDVDNLRLDGNTISTTNTNGDIIITPNGSGGTLISTTTDSGARLSVGDAVAQSNWPVAINSNNKYTGTSAAHGSISTITVDSDISSGTRYIRGYYSPYGYVDSTLSAGTLEMMGSYVAGHCSGSTISGGTANIYGHLIHFDPTSLTISGTPTINYYGMRVGITSPFALNLGTTGTVTKYAGYFTMGGTGDTNYGIYTSASGGTTANYAIYSNGGTNVFTGNVGIGTASPTSNLHIYEAEDYGSPLDNSVNKTFSYKQIAPTFAIGNEFSFTMYLDRKEFSLANMSVIDPEDPGSATIYNDYSLIYGTPTINDASGAESSSVTCYGYFSSISYAPALTSVSNEFQLDNYAGYFSTNVASAGNANFTPTNYGIYVESLGNLTTTGTTAHYGARISVGGTANNNYGIYITCVGATNNYALTVASGIVDIDTQTNIGNLRLDGNTLSSVSGNIGIEPVSGSNFAITTAGVGQVSITGGAASGKATLAIWQVDEDKGFIDFNGTYGEDPAVVNLTSINGEDVVVGPKSSLSGEASWNFEGMIRVQVNGSEDRWIPMYSFVAAVPSSGACPRVDAFINEEWISVGRAIKFHSGKENEGVYVIELEVPATRFRLVEDEPEVSHIHSIWNEHGQIAIENVTTEPAPQNSLGKTDGLWTMEFEFDEATTSIFTYGYYDHIMTN